MDMGELPEGWASWEVKPIEPGMRKSAEEILVGGGRIARAAMVRRVVERPAGSAVRRRIYTSAIRGAYGLFNRGDMRFLEGGYAEDCDLDFQAFEPVGLPRAVHGRPAAAAYLRELRETLGVLYLPRLIVDPGGATFAGMAEFRAVGKVSGIELGAEHWNLWTIEDGLVAKQTISADREAVLTELY